MISKYRSIALALLTGLALSGAPLAPAVAKEAAASASPAEIARLARLKPLLEGYVAEQRLAGAVLLVYRDGRPIVSEAVGWRDKEAGAPMTTDTIFRIASQTKALVTVATMMLQEEGKLLLSDPVGKYLPEWSQTSVAVPRPAGGYEIVPAKRAITIRDLLTHTAGISYGDGPAKDAWLAARLQGWYFSGSAEPMADIVARMAKLPMAKQPGEAFVYGYATDVLGVLVEKVTGKTLDALLRERIIDPIGMKDTRFYVEPQNLPRLAALYALEKGTNSIKRAPDGFAMTGQGAYGKGPGSTFSGGAGLTSTAADYMRFLEMLRRGGVAPNGVRILSRKSVELMTANHLAPGQEEPGGGFGLGFRVTRDVGRKGELGSVGEYGWGGAYHSTYWVNPSERLSVVYLSQLNPAAGIDDHEKIRALIYQALD